jgi:3',5'-cyclic AMP phosphodiesterase CpdA
MTKLIKNRIYCLALLTLVLTACAPADYSEEARIESISTPVIIRGPYLQYVTPNSVLVVWETDGLARGAVEYGTTLQYGAYATDYILSNRHAIRLEKLNPYTTYHYRVHAGTLTYSEDNTFKSAAVKEQDSFRFCVIGDTQVVSDKLRQLGKRMVDYSPDFFIVVGDLVEDGSDMNRWDRFFEWGRVLMKGSPLFTTLGNHEENDINYYNLFYLPNNEIWYSFDYGNVHFIALENNGFTPLSKGSEQYRWLENDLAGNKSRWTVVFCHIPFYDSTLSQDVKILRDDLQPLFERYKVDMVLSGHAHDYERSVVNGIQYIVTGGGTAAWKDRMVFEERTIYFEKTLHYLEINVNGNRLSSVGIRPDGTTFDAFSIEKR